MSEPMGNWVPGVRGIAEFDQTHAKALEALRRARAFYLATTDESGTTFCCGIPVEYESVEAVEYLREVVVNATKLAIEISEGDDADGVDASD